MTLGDESDIVANLNTEIGRQARRNPGSAGMDSCEAKLPLVDQWLHSEQATNTIPRPIIVSLKCVVIKRSEWAVMACRPERDTRGTMRADATLGCRAKDDAKFHIGVTHLLRDFLADEPA